MTKHGRFGNPPSLTSPIHLAQQSYAAAEHRYQIGVGSILELLNTQSALANAKKQRIQALTDWRSARLQLASKLGRLDMDSLASAMR
ncbi:hypothetical protein Bpla01_28540 [Burkholderia plantarii]|nr:Fis family transcriptional regulator [Burkholderia plantarii]GLZ19324.1 hypothetical protein Bpla01_28540 [Burkholderia plantarii]